MYKIHLSSLDPWFSFSVWLTSWPVCSGSLMKLTLFIFKSEKSVLRPVTAADVQMVRPSQLRITKLLVLCDFHAQPPTMVSLYLKKSKLVSEANGSPWGVLLVCVTLMTGARCTWVCICWAAAAMFAMVLRWFIWDIAIATDAGGSPMGSRGWGIIMNGRSNPETDRRGRPVSKTVKSGNRRTRWRLHFQVNKHLMP